jgi:predicted nucleic acid-binding protein
MTDKFFIDTNIFVYAHFQDSDKKTNIASDLLETLPVLISSTQVLNEYYSVMLKKKIADNLIQENIEIIIGITDIQLIQVTTIRLAHKLKLKYGFSYWDSLVLAAALENQCTTIYSEDMQHKQIIEGKLQIINPFL